MLGYSTENIVLTSFYSLIILVGVFSNVVIICVVFRKRQMQTTTNILLASNACADLLTLLWCIPFLSLKFFPHPTGLVGNIVCVLVTKQNVTSITLCVSMLTLCLLAIERYNALLKPMKENLRLSKGTVGYALLCVWTLSTIFGLPLFIKTYYEESTRRCKFHFETRLFWIVSGSCLLILISITCFCYSRIIKGLYFTNAVCAAKPTIDKHREVCEKRKVLKLLLFITSAFVLCLTPRVLYFFFSPLMKHKKDISVFKRLSFLFLISNSTINPVICLTQNTNYITCLQNMYRRIKLIRIWRKKPR